MHGQHHPQQPWGQAQECHQGLQPVSCSAPGAGEQHHKSPNLTHVGIHSPALLCYSTKLQKLTLRKEG